MDNPFSTGALESFQDPRTVNYEPTLAVLYTTGGYAYTPEEHEHQHKVGICTAISLVQLMQKANGRDYSPDLQYLLQKKFYDGNWNEGSSILNALKVGKRYGFLPANLWTYTTEADRSLPHAQYIAKLKAIPESEIIRLAGRYNAATGAVEGGLCIDRVDGYAQVDVNNPVDIARAITDSRSGILCRYAIGSEWWTDPINPLRKPVQTISGHAIIMSSFDYLLGVKHVLANTWGALWAKQGNADIVWSNYRPTEGWVVTGKRYFLDDLWLGMVNPDVRFLQKFLNLHGFPVALTGQGSIDNETENFGTLTQKALIKFQISNNIHPSAGYCGIITRTKINSLL